MASRSPFDAAALARQAQQPDADHGTSSSEPDPTPTSVEPEDVLVVEDVSPFDESIPVLPPASDFDDEVDGRIDIEPVAPDAARPAVAHQSLVDRLRSHRPTQFGVLLLLVAGGLAILPFREREAEPPEGGQAAPRSQRFPKIPVDGLDEPLSSGDIRRLLDHAAAKQEATKSAAHPEPVPVPDPAPSDPSLIRARPGELYDDSGHVGVIVGTPEDRARVLRRERAQARPRNVEPPAVAARDPQPRRLGAAFFEPGGTLVVQDTAGPTTRPSLGLSLGTIVDATLVIGVSSLEPNVVVARVEREVRVGGLVVVERGATLRGRARGDGDRLFLTFHQLSQRGQSFRFEGHATDGKMPGLAAIVRTSSFEQRSRSGAGRGVVGAAGGILGELVGQSLPGRVARGVADGVATEAQQELRPDRSRVLELPVGRRLQVVVAGGAS